MATIPFATLQAADARSRELWEHILGGPKQPQNVTEFLFGRIEEVDEETGEKTGNVYMDIPQRDAYLDRLLREDQMTADEIAALVNLYPAWASGTAYAVGDLCAYNGRLYRVIQAHRSQADWTPPQVPALFVDVAPANVIPAWVQPLGSHDSYQAGQQVTHNGKIWRSTINANVWEPGVVAGLWIVV